MRVAGIVPESVVDGPSIRYTLFLPGCLHDCPKCQNAALQDFHYGYEMSIPEILDDISKYKAVSSFSLSGGDPLFSAKAAAELCRHVKKRFKFDDIYCYTGFTFEEIMSGKVPQGIELLQTVDFLVDGRFLIEKRDLSLDFRGSSNQRIIDLKRTFSTGHLHCIDFIDGKLQEITPSSINIA